MVSTRIIILLVVAIICGVLFYAAFFKIPILGICGLFPYEKEVLVRHLACSLAMCANGCSWVQEQGDKLCLERDCITGECKKSCDTYCTNPPSSWPENPTGSGPNETCGRNYNISLLLEEKVALKGNTFCGEKKTIIPYIWTICTEWITETQYIIRQLNKLEGFPKLPIEGEIWVRKPEWAGVIPPTPYTLPMIIDLTGSGIIMITPEDAVEKFGCSGPSEIDGYNQCLFQGNLNIWSSYKKPYDYSFGADAWVTSFVPPPATFELEVTPCEGKTKCNGNCERIRLGEEACFKVKVTNKLGTGSDFSLFISGYTLNDAPKNDNDIGCDFTGNNCKEVFSDNPLKISDGEGGSDETTLTFKPNIEGIYKIWIVADPSAAYDSESAVVELRVVDFEVQLRPDADQQTKMNKPKSWNIWIRNDLDKPDDFTLTKYSDPGSACQLSSNTVHVENGIGWSNVGTIECSSSQIGEYTIYVKATSTNYPDISDESNRVKLIVVKCLGEINLTLNPKSVAFGNSFSAKAFGLSGCNGERVYFRIDDYNDPSMEIGYCDIPASGDGSECTTIINADNSKFSLGAHTVYALIDTTGDTDYDDIGEKNSASLSVFGYLIDHIDIVKNSVFEGFHGCGSTCYVLESNFNSYIDPSWYGSDVTWMGYAKVEVGKCCWIGGNSGPLKMDVMFCNVDTLECTKKTIIRDEGVHNIIWDLGSIDTPGKWYLRTISYGTCFNIWEWWCPAPNIYEGVMIPVVKIG